MSRGPAFLEYYSRREWAVIGFIFLACLAVRSIAAYLLPPGSYLYPTSAVALTALFFCGIRLWPPVFAALLLANFLADVPAPLLYVLPAAQTLQAVIGAHLLKKAHIDPLFRRYRDTFYMIATTLLVSVITPTFLLFVEFPMSRGWWYGYVATVFVLLILCPFLLRWFAKRTFKRTPIEVIETIAIFALLVGINAALFLEGATSVAGIPLIYLLLFPFFWIAIRLRPRFVTLALLVTSGFALYAAITGSAPDTLADRLFSAEIFLIALATAFYIIVSLEEDRRASTNLARSQLQTLENAVSRISSESQAKNDFIAILAHELRNPLAPVVSSIELLKIKSAKNHEDAETLQTMEESMHTVRRLLDDLLDISRIAEGKIALKAETLDIGQIIRRAVVSTAHHFKERHQTLAFTGSRTPLFVAGDAVRLEQVFSNLLTNASKYSDSGSTVSLTVAHPGDTAEIRITDEGYGIPSEALQTIFLPFHQLERGKRSKKGLGIGLALVHSFVEMHNGTITAESEGENKGSTFTVRLPLVEGAAETKPRKPRSRIDLPRKRSGPAVLVVDDNEAAAAGVGKLLELQGCVVSFAHTGAAAIEQTESNPDVILLDIGLPDQDGHMVARTLRTSGYAGLLVALSGFSTPDAQQEAVQAGFDHYLVKPAGLAELKNVLPGLG